jgi:hypothetical protein
MTDLLERLRKVEPDLPGDRTRWYRNPDGHEAAAEIERLRETLQKICGIQGSGDCCSTYSLLVYAKEIARATLKEKD